MVFESIVADVLNRVLGDYVENLDRSQLKIGIWGGDVVLKDLILKQNALEELNVPVQIVYGHLGKLVLKIPWKNLYGASVEASVENLYLVVNPLAEVRYDEEREQTMLLAAKQAELQRVEEAKKKEAEIDTKVNDTLVEKLVAQIIKNVQLKIKNIHVRYEDSLTNPDAPFSCGFTLHNLSVHTTDEKWNQTVLNEAVTKVYKILNLDSLAVYWNPKTSLHSRMDRKEIITLMHDEIANKTFQPKHFEYILGPINATSKLVLNPKPEEDEPRFSIPKVMLTLHMEQLLVSINKNQYQDLMKIADTMERMRKGIPYRKYRPDLKSYRGHYKEWWHFAYKCILEEEVRRARRNWDWAHIKGHRELCKEYGKAYQTKLCSKGKCVPAVLVKLEEGEKKLDLVNLVIIRQRMELEVARIGKQQAEASKAGGWLGGWFGWGQAADDKSEDADILAKFQNAMTPEEKSKLYRAIDYQENTAPLHLPAEYVATEAVFKLDTLRVLVTDAGVQVLKAAVQNVNVDFSQRPSADSIKVVAQMEKFDVLGVEKDGKFPSLVTSTPEDESGGNLLDVSFETNPLTKNCNQMVTLSARPLQVIYDAKTIIDVVKLFQLPQESSALAHMQEVAGNKLSDLKEMSALGMQHAVKTHNFVDINIDVASSYIVVPYGGVYTGKEACLVVKLGAITVVTEPRKHSSAIDIHQMFQQGIDNEEILKELMNQTYDKMIVQLTQMQVVIAGIDEDWRQAIRGDRITPMHLLQPTTLKIDIMKCLLTDDPRLPKIKIRGELEQIAINASEDRLMTVLDLAVSMPVPQDEEPLKNTERQGDSRASSMSLLKYLDPTDKAKREKPIDNKEELVQLTDLEAFFVMKDFSLNVSSQRALKSEDSLTEDAIPQGHPLLTFSLKKLELIATKKTFNLDVALRLGIVNLQHFRLDSPTINVIDTSAEKDKDDLEYLLVVKYSDIGRKSPDFHGIEKLITVEFNTLKVLLHLEGLQQLYAIINGIQLRVQKVQGQKDRLATTRGALDTILEEGQAVLKQPSKATVPKKERHRKVETIQLKVQLQLNAVLVRFATERRRLADIRVYGLKTGLVLKQSYTQVDVSLDDVLVLDPNPASIHSEIAKVLGSEVMKVRVVLFNVEQYPKVSDCNMSIDASVSCMRIVFLNWFVSSMLDFMNNFQAAQQAIIEASSQAADAARANVASAYENSTKISLRVSFSAPLIIIPQNSQSRLAVVADLGQMSLNNTIYNLPVENVENDVTVDDLTLALVNIKISTAHLSETYEFERERMLLSPISFNLYVQRSLSGWYKPLADLSISGRLQTVVITVAQNDMKTIMKVLNQNLKEGQEGPKKKEVKVQPASKQLKAKPSIAKAISKQDASPMKGEVPRVSVKFKFSLDSLVIDLVNTGENESMTDLTKPQQETGLARFCLALLCVKGRILSNESMHTSVLLVDCTLDDMRPGREDKVTRYFERRVQSNAIRRERDELTVKVDSADKVRSMIDITYNTKGIDSFVDIKVFSFNLILAMDFLLKVTEFVTAGAEKLAPEKGQELVIDNPVLKKRSSEVSTVQKPAMMTVNLKVEQPDIILIESLEDKECSALVMNTEISFKMRSNQERTVMDGAITDLQLYTRHGWSSEAVRCEDEPKKYLLEPCCISLAAAQPPDTGTHADIIISDIKINVSPDLIGLLNRVIATMTNTEDTNSEEESDRIYTYDNLWAMKPFTQDTYWFLKTDLGQDALETEFDDAPSGALVSGEICMVSSASIVISVEIPVGDETIPILVMQSALSAQVCDWSSKLHLQSTWAMEVKYYNIARAYWEPLVEPIEMLKDNQYKHIPWELKLEVLIESSQDSTPTLEPSESSVIVEEAPKSGPKKSVMVSSDEPLEITITGTCLDVLKQISSSFSAALEVNPDDNGDKSKVEKELSSYSTSGVVHSKHHGAPYVLHNCTGYTVKVQLEKGNDFAVFIRKNTKASAPAYKEVVLKPDASVPLQLKKVALNLLSLDNNLPNFKLNILIDELQQEFIIPVERVDKRFFPLDTNYGSNTSLASDTKGLIAEVALHDGAINVYLRSVVQVLNKLSQSVTVYYMTPSGNEVCSLGSVEPGEVLRMPLMAAYTPTAEIFFCVEGFSLSVTPFVWRELQQELKITKVLHCESKDKSSNAEKFYIQAVGTMEQVYLEDTNKHTLASNCYNITLKPTVKLHNCLPIDIVVSQLGLKRTETLQPGQMIQLTHLASRKATLVIMLENYMDKCWTCTKQLPSGEEELVVWSFESHDSPAVMTLDLGMHTIDQDGTQMLSLYCPFWMLNKTGLTLSYRTADESSNVIHHRADNLEPVLFSFRAKNFFGKKKAAVRIEFGEWSERFPLDVAGSSGVIVCRNEGRQYQVAVTNQFTYNSLTKMVIFTPFFIIINECPFAVECQEMMRSADKWLRVEGKSSSALWPYSEKEDKLLLTRVAGSKENCLPFLYTEPHFTTLKLNNEYGGLTVEVQTTEGGNFITIKQYKNGLAPALLINFSPHLVEFYEKENVNVRNLSSMHQTLYSWDNPAGPRILIFSAHKREIETDLRKDTIGELQLNPTTTIYWVSFLDGLQRVILFTENDLLAQAIHTVGDLEVLDMEMTLSIQGIGLSLINDAQHKEIIYITISNSGIVWEQSKVGSHRYKKMEPNKVLMLEDAYQRYQTEKLIHKEEGSSIVKFENKMEVDFAEMRQLRPNARKLRRTLKPGLWASVGSSAHVRRIHARLHRLQVDEQLACPTFPVVLAPVAPPRSIVNEGDMKPFVEVSIVERLKEHTYVKQYKYYRILVQEFHVKIDMELINALMELFPEKMPTEQEALELFANDLRTAARPLDLVAAEVVASGQENFYDNLHLSPLKVHLSFSMSGATASSLPSFVGPVLQSIGVTLTDMNDVVFKLAYYEKNYEFLSQRTLIDQVTRHYAGQAIKQLYVLVLGLDVIGNPYGLVIGLKKGVEDLFYEPFQGAIQGPGEFVEGLCLGVRSLVGHTVGGAAGAVSRIAGAMGSGLAALSLDEDFQKRRRDNKNKKPANLQEGLARSSKGLVMGVFDGVTGVFTKPISGAREQGVEGFFKGLGKGAVGLVARPTAGVVDFASGSLDAVKRAADMSEEVMRRRPPRYLPPDSGVKPYSRVQAEGYRLLIDLEKGKFSNTDAYATHVWVVPQREVVLCTDQRILYLEKNNVFGGFTVVWSFLWTDLTDPPTIVDRGIMVPMPKKKVLGMFASSQHGKLIPIYDEQQKTYLHLQCQRLLKEAR